MISLSVPSVAPSNLTLTPLTESSIKAEWDEMQTNISGYIIFYREVEFNGDYKRLATLKTATLFGLQPHTQYEFRVLAYNENGNGVSSKVNSAFTKESGMSQT